MSTKIGINGFGRMGRLALRAGWTRTDLDFVHINEPAGDAGVSAHLLEFDSVHGRWDRSPKVVDGTVVIDDRRLTHTGASTPSEVDWRAHGVEVVLECSGKFRTLESLDAYFRAGVKKVIVAAPVEDALNIVVGVNHRLYDPAAHDVITAASCTTNCLAPVVKVVHENLGIRHGVITTIHDVTNTQRVVDLAHRDLRRARAAWTSLIPTSTGSAKAITMIYPELEGRLNGLAVRVPVLNASLTDCVFELERSTTGDEVNALFEAAATEGPLAGILGYESRPLVSVDYVDDPRSSIVDGPMTMVVDGTQLKVLAWYDNEWGYVNRMIELTEQVIALLD